ncbi:MULTISPECIES: sulfotransferase [Winogradskyella]|uniref:Sulfotransferase family protein n=1 Tax=Winogradskyella thalassocola TaxID=262004 RepID=A0A1G8FXE8_9FLAO|nr:MULTISPECIES: sulfotransferase [Winogradskyella]SDH86824.1 hypothetical protein SAMN04489796_10526 [Winogradskyella thalassocola]
MEDKTRKKDHKKNTSLEQIFPELESLLGFSEAKVLKDYTVPAKKVYLIVGCARSGSTILYQFLANTSYFCYPTNFLSRFYYAPYIGYRIQQALIDFDHKGEIFSKEHKEEKSFKSTLGKTKGPLQPHEFWYFWNRFFKFGATQKLSLSELDEVDWKTFLQELHALEAAANKPLLMKAMNLNWNLNELKEKIPNCHFIYIKRDVIYNAQSLLLARESFFGNYDDWYSYKTPNYQTIKKLKPAEQVIEQVIENNVSIEADLLKMDAEDYTTISYNDFCKKPNDLINTLNKKGAAIDTDNTQSSFNNGDVAKINDDLFKELKSYFETR